MRDLDSSHWHLPSFHCPFFPGEGEDEYVISYRHDIVDYHFGETAGRGCAAYSVREPQPILRDAVREKLSKPGKEVWKPDTKLGKKLLALSDRYGEDRLSPEAIGATEFVTSELPGKPLFRVKEIGVKTIFQA